MVLQIVYPLTDTLLNRMWEEDTKNTSQLKSVARYVTLRRYLLSCVWCCSYTGHLVVSVLCAVTLPLVSYTYLEMVQVRPYSLPPQKVPVALLHPFKFTHTHTHTRTPPTGCTLVFSRLSYRGPCYWQVAPNNFPSQYSLVRPSSTAWHPTLLATCSGVPCAGLCPDLRLHPPPPLPAAPLGRP